MNKSEIRDAFRAGDPADFEYENDEVSLGAVLQYEGQAKIEHFVVKRDARGQGIATTVLECLEDVLKEDGVYTLTIQIQAADSNTMEELENSEAGADEEYGDPTERFLKERGFQDIQPTETYQWGLCFKANKILR